MLNLDPQIIDQDKIRLRRRKKLLKYAIIPIILLLFIGVFFLRTGFYNVVYKLSYENRNYDTPASLSSMQLFGNMIQPYIAYYNRGTAELNISQYNEAEDDFRASLRENPPKAHLCKIYVNLSFSIEMQADRAAQRKLYDEALVLYNRAESVLHENNCASKDGEGGGDAKAEESQERINSKRRRAVQQMNNKDEGQGSEDFDSSEISQDDLEAMRSMQNTSDSIRSLQYSLGKGAANGYNNYDKPW
jgi:tetratricopeptide (TPR) repeat protein